MLHELAETCRPWRIPRPPVLLQASKKISNEIQWMSSIQAYKVPKQEGSMAARTLVSKVHKQGALSHVTSQCIFPSIPTSVAALRVNNQAVFFYLVLLESISVSYGYNAATDIGMLGKIHCDVTQLSAPCLCTLLTSVLATIDPSCLCTL